MLSLCVLNWLLLLTREISGKVSSAKSRQITLYATQVHHAVRDTYDEAYVLNVPIGTPAKTFNLTLDYSWDASFLFPRQTQLLCYDRVPTRQSYSERESNSSVDPRQSYSGLNLGEPYTSYCNCFFSNSCTLDTGKFLYDTFQVGDVSVTGTPFAFAINDGNVLNAEWPSDGILGIQPWQRSDIPDVYSTVGRILAAYGKRSAFYKRLISVYIEPRYAHLDYPVVGGALTVGMKDVANCESRWTYLYGSTSAVAIQSFNLGTYKAESDAFPASGQLLSTSMYIYAPRFVMDAVVSELRADYYWPTDNYIIPCAQISSLPDMTFGLQGFEYRMSGKDYVRQIHIDMDRRHCTLMFAQSDDPFGTSWTLGTTFLRPYCHLFDFDRNAVAFARPLS